MNRPGLTPLQWRVWSLAAAGKVLEGLVVFMGGFTLPLAREELGLERLGLFGAAPLIGILAGAPLLGSLADRWGRRPVFLGEMALLLAGLLGAALSPSPAWLLVGLLLIGLALGADYPTGHLVISEQIGTRWRGPLILASFAGQAVGALAGALLGLAAGPAGVLSWRACYLLPLVPVAVLTWARLGVPESPGWRPPPPPGSRPGPGPIVWRPVLLASLPWFLQDLSTYGVGIFLPLLLAGEAEGSAATWEPLLEEAFFLAGILLAIPLCDRLGRIPLQVGGFVGCALGLGLGGWGSRAAAPHPALTALGLGVFLFMTNLGPNATTYLIAGEVFPQERRGRDAGLAAGAGKVGAVLAVLALPWLWNRWGAAAVLTGLACSSLLGAAVSWLLRIETRHLDTGAGPG